MRRAICPQPIKRHYFSNTKEEIYKIMKYRCHLGMLLGIIALPFICLLLK